MNSGTGPPGTSELRDLLEVASLEDEPVFQFAKWLVLLTSTAGVLAGGLQVAGFPNLSGLGVYVFAVAVALLGLSLALAVTAVAARLDGITDGSTTVQDWKLELLQRSQRRKSRVEASAWSFGSGLVLAALSPLASTIGINPARDTVAIEYSIKHDSLTHLNANALGIGLVRGVTVRLELLGEHGAVLSSGQAAADSAGRANVTVEVNDLRAANGSILVQASQEGVFKDSLRVDYQRP